MDDTHGGVAADAAIVSALARELLGLTDRTRERSDEDPFGNPVLSIALAITKRLDRGSLSEAEVESLVRHLRDAAFRDRARRLAAYVGGVNISENEAALAGLAERLVRPDPEDSPVPFARYRALIERTRFAAVFTAHPTFALPAAVARDLAELASGRTAAQRVPSHRPQPVTLADEFDQVTTAIGHGRDAFDRLTGALLGAARACWPDRWSTLIPRPIVVASWVGYDTDGRTDIGWWDVLRLRLAMKRLQLARIDGQLAPLTAAAPLRSRIATALGAVERQIDACPSRADADDVARFAGILIGERDAAMTTLEPLEPLFRGAIGNAGEVERMTLCRARAGLVAHGLALAHTHVRLNSSQVHNAIRQRLGFNDPPEDPARRRALLNAINTAMDSVQPVAVDFGALLAEQASACRLVMTVAQIVKHIDATAPVRFLIAETETGYTLLAALWLAKLYGVDRALEISPLFETAEALEHGVRVLEEALRSPHYRSYLQRMGRLAVQFGYSDSGRYVGQLTASYLIERLKLKLSESLRRHELTDVELILFDTHGESIGRGAHPGSLSDRLAYLTPPAPRVAFEVAGIEYREESSFQGGDGYLLWDTDELALATVARIAEHAYDTHPPAPDAIYAEPDFAADFFASVEAGMTELVADPGYAALLGAFGPMLIDPTGSRPTARQIEGMGSIEIIRHPRELRAIPNNAILQQLGWCANTLQGMGEAAARNPEPFADFSKTSPRFRRALDFARHALAHSDLDVLRAVIVTLDPGSWLDRAAHTKRPRRREELVSVARALEQLDLWASTAAMFRRIQADHLALRAAWPTAPQMATRELLLHALRLCLIHRIWFLESSIPDFAARQGLTRKILQSRIFRLDVSAALAALTEIFPARPDPSADRDFGEPHAPRAASSYAREHAEIFEPMRRLFGIVREIGTAITHEIGAFG
jgi:phosphoenolpyruvate carboxylase